MNYLLRSIVAALFAVLALDSSLRAQQTVTYAFSGVMEGSSIFSEGTPFTGSFTYSYPQQPSTGGTYRLQSYNLTIQGQSQPISGITSGSGLIVFQGSTVTLPGTTWSGAYVTGGIPPITVTDGFPDTFSVFIARFYTTELTQGKLLIYGPDITLSDSTGRIFDNVNLPDISVLQDRFTSGSIGIAYEVQGVSWAAQNGRITSLAPSHAQPLVNIETVTVGDAGNGAVANVFAMGKYEVTIGQYTTFLNSVASVASDSHIVNLWNSNMATDLNIAGISRSGSGTVGDPYNYSVISPSGITPPGASSPGNRPIAYVSWFDAARFVNWLHNGATNGASTETGAYTLNGATSGVSFTKNAEATWWIPSMAQWFQAAYHKGGGTNAGAWLYPTQSDSAPGNAIGGAANQANHQVGGIFAVTQSPVYSATQNYLTDVGAFSNSASAYGTFDQGGNVFEWNDDVAGDGGRGVRGSAAMAHEFYMRNYDTTGYPDPSEEFNYVGFRVASVAEAPPTPTPTPSPTPIPALTPVITSATAASGTVGTAFSYQIAASNTPASFGAMGLPNGLSINTATGLISGTPTTAGTFNVSISATNSGGTGSATLTLTINKASQTIAAFNTVPSRTFGDAPFAVTIPAATSGLVVILSVKSGPATVSGNIVTLTGVGTVVLAANQAGNSNCNAAPEVTTSFTVSPSTTPTPTPSVVLAVEKTTGLSGQWEFTPITADMITPSGELDVGSMTNPNEFYRLKIRTEVE